MSNAAATPVVSVIVPLWNSERHLAETIASIDAQRIDGLQVVFVDDGSSDRSGRLARSLAPAAVHLRQPHQGIAAALNRGVSLASGRYLTFLDADDLWPAQSLALRLAACREHPALDLIAGHVRQFASPELDDDFRRSLVYPEQPLPGYVMGAMLVRATAYVNDRRSRDPRTLARPGHDAWAIPSRSPIQVTRRERSRRARPRRSRGARAPVGRVCASHLPRAIQSDRIRVGSLAVSASSSPLGR